MDLDAFRWLLTDDGAALLARATDLAGGPELAIQAELRRTASPERVAAALTQVELRARGAAKFGSDAARMFFTPDGLEQATRARVATHRAGRLQAFGTATLIDLGCGIGGDLLASARAGITCAGVDLDPVRVAVAEANLAALGLAGAVMVADVTALDTSPFEVAFADPARRTGAGRSFRVEDWTPPWPFVERLLARDSCVKVAPGIPHDLVPEGVEAVHTGNPVRGAVLDRAGAGYITPGDYPMSILVIGGSQGARALSDTVPAAIADLPERLLRHVSVSHQARDEDGERVREFYDTHGIRADVQPFFSDVPARLSEAQLVISRAGAGSVADISVIGRPSILIPYPHATEDHQTANARGLVDAQAAILIPESQLDVPTLSAQIAAVLDNPQGARLMAAAALAQGIPDATQRLADMVHDLTGVDE